MKLKDKVAIVTGAGSGIGAETARHMAREGAKVYCADIRAEAAEKTAKEIGGDAKSLELDVTSSSAIAAAVERISREAGRIDILVNNAGITIVGSIMDLSEEQWDRELDINLKSIFLMSRAVWPKMAGQGGGVILNTASIAGITAIPADAAYCASKAGVVMLTKCMAVDGARSGIRVNCVCPGFIDTPMIHGYFNDQPDPAAARDYAVRLHPLGRLGRPDDIADAFVHLATDDAKWVTGTAHVVDGGLLAGLPG
jgi:NAD(P)-dependent dehydrogenase (short-subunit alcohol dehydrogenase family)